MRFSFALMILLGGSGGLEKLLERLTVELAVVVVR